MKTARLIELLTRIEEESPGCELSAVHPGIEDAGFSIREARAVDGRAVLVLEDETAEEDADPGPFSVG